MNVRLDPTKIAALHRSPKYTVDRRSRPGPRFRAALRAIVWVLAALGFAAACVATVLLIP